MVDCGGCVPSLPVLVIAKRKDISGWKSENKAATALAKGHAIETIESQTQPNELFCELLNQVAEGRNR